MGTGVTSSLLPPKTEKSFKQSKFSSQLAESCLLTAENFKIQSTQTKGINEKIYGQASRPISTS
jgi:hypothetical protein